MLRSIFRSAASTAVVAPCHHQSSLLLSSTNPFPGASHSYARAKTPKTTNKKRKVMVKIPHTGGGLATVVETSSAEYVNTAFELSTNPLPVTSDPTLDISSSGCPLFNFTDSFAPLTRKQANTYVDFSLEERNAMLPEGIIDGMKKEFKDMTLCHDGATEILGFA